MAEAEKKKMEKEALKEKANVSTKKEVKGQTYEAFWKKRIIFFVKNEQDFLQEELVIKKVTFVTKFPWSQYL